MKTTYQECELGHYFETDSCYVFFGNANADLEKIEAKFPQYEFFRVKQTHSDILVPASADLREGDAHWTGEKRKALVISTADCLPIMVEFVSSTPAILAIHAGWRGIENQIAFKALAVLKSKMGEATSINLWIGPHILQKSFEVKAEVLHLLLQSSYTANKKDLYQDLSGRFYVDLKAIALSQISAVGVILNSCSDVPIDTRLSDDLHSYRRNGANAGRNISFISLK